MRELKAVLSLAILLAAVPLKGSVTVVAPDDPRIRIMGRHDASDPKAPAFDWPAVNVRVAVLGRDLAFLVEDPKGTNHLNVAVDGKPVTVMAMRPGSNRVPVPGLGAGRSVVVLSKRTEGFQGPVVLKGLELGEGTRLEEAPALPRRRIEFIGDSWTCGYGNEGVTHGNCPNLAAVSNSDRAFPVVLAGKLDAQYHVTAVSGRGILRNYGEKKAVADTNMPLEYSRVLFSRPESKWDCRRFVPEVVVLRLGVNDHSTQPAPAEADFVRAYAAFLERLRSCYGQAEIFCFADEGWPDYKPRILAAMEARRRKGDTRLHWVGNRGFSPSELGCDWHPSVRAHWKLAEVLEREIRPVMGWDDWGTPTPTPTEVPLKARPTPTPTRTPVVIPPPPGD
jgi:lysophospholipase L1-like esterase